MLQCGQGFPGSSVAKESYKAEDVGSIPWPDDSLEEGMATHSNILDWRIPMDREEPGRLQFMGSQKVGHD